MHVSGIGPKVAQCMTAKQGGTVTVGPHEVRLATAAPARPRPGLAIAPNPAEGRERISCGYC